MTGYYVVLPPPNTVKLNTQIKLDKRNMFGVWNGKKKKEASVFSKSLVVFVQHTRYGVQSLQCSGQNAPHSSEVTVVTRILWLEQTVRGCSLPFHERSGEHDFPFAGCTQQCLCISSRSVVESRTQTIVGNTILECNI